MRTWPGGPSRGERRPAPFYGVNGLTTRRYVHRPARVRKPPDWGLRLFIGGWATFIVLCAYAGGWMRG